MYIRDSSFADELDVEKTGYISHNNKKINPLDLKMGSNKFVWWKCSKCSHSWEMMPNSRKEPKGNGCTYCAGRVVHSDGRNSLAKMHSDIGDEFLSCLTKPTLNPKNMTEKSGQLCLWKCTKVSATPCGHEWVAYPKKRVGRGDGCTCCAGRVIHIDGRNSLATLRPKIAEEFHPTKNGDLDPEMLMENSNFEKAKLIWWICKTVSETSCGHHWQASPNSRSQGHGCPSCRGTAIHSEDARNSLANHEICKELDPEKNQGIDFTKMRPSVKKNLWWLCDVCGNSYRQLANNRVNGQGCPDCSPVGFQNTKPGFYYVHEISSLSGKFLFYKAGISNDWKRRLKQLKRGLNKGLQIKNLDFVHYKVGREARAIERRMIEIAKVEGWKVDNHDFDGGTELFSCNPISRMVEMKIIQPKIQSRN